MALVPDAKRPKFTYTGLLQYDSIRLLLLQPASVKSSDLRCSLIHTTLQECSYDIVEHYVALSYVWGDTAKPQIIWIDGTPVSVTKNLYSALQHLRDPKRILHLWVDALCINQSDEEEKFQQVSIMANIYFLARITVIFLGPLDPDTMQLFNHSNGDSIETQAPRELQKADFILCQPWFRRVWVFQELIFSREPWIQCGDIRWTWDSFYLQIQNVLAQTGEPSELDVVRRLQTTASPLCESSLVGYKCLSKMQRTRERYLNSGINHGLSLVNLLPDRRGLGATDPRDMIYAHLSFTDDSYHGKLVADYTKSCAQVYEDFAYYEIETSFNCKILSHVGLYNQPTRPKELASWAPDWSAIKFTTPLNAEGPIAEALCDYHDNGFFGYHHTWIDMRSTLVLFGNVIDIVVHSSVPLSVRDISFQKHSEFSSRLADIHRYIDTRFEADQEARSQLYRDIYQEWKDLLKDDEILSSSYNNDRERITSFFRYMFAFGPDHRDEADTYYSESRQVIDYLVWYFHQGTSRGTQALVDGRAIARLASGRLALVPADVQEGDMVLRLPGAEDGPGIFSFVQHGPHFLIRPFNTIQGRISDKLRKEIAFVLKTYQEQVGWAGVGTPFPGGIGDGHWLAEILSLRFSEIEDCFLHCTLVGDCVVDTPHLPPQRARTRAQESALVEHLIRAIAIN